MMKSLTILGAGWLGLELARTLKDSYKIKVSIRNEQKREFMINEGFSPYLLNEENLENLDELLNSDYVFINFPPSKSDNYLNFLNNLG